MSRAYDLHRNGDCDTFCPVCQWEDAQDPQDDETEDDE